MDKLEVDNFNWISIIDNENNNNNNDDENNKKKNMNKFLQHLREKIHVKMEK